MCSIGVFFGVWLFSFKLKRRIGEQPDKVGLCGYLQRHEVEYDYLQRTDILHVSTRIVHHEDMLFLEQLYGRKFVW